MRFKLAAVAAAVTLVALTTGGAAFAAYEDPVVTINLDNIDLGSGGGTGSGSSGVVVAGGDVAGTVKSSVPCHWTATFNGTAQDGSGLSFTFSFGTPMVDKKTTFVLTVKCVYDDGNTNGASAAISDPSAVTPAFYVPATSTMLPTALQTVTRSVNIVVVPTLGGNGNENASANQSGVIPNTGGPNVLWIGAGVVLLLGGAGVVVAARRKHDQVA